MITLTDRYTRAVEVARVAHDGGLRKGTEVPYLSHVLIVSALVLEHGGDEDQAIAALLHDVAEDAGGQQRLDEIGAEFGEGVQAIVAGCSDSLLADPTVKEAWWVRKTRYLDHLATAERRVLLVSAADKVHNGEAILADYVTDGEGLWSRFNEASQRGGQLWYQTEVAAILSDGLAGTPGAPLAARLDRAVRSLRERVEATVGAAQVADDLAWAQDQAAAARGN